MNGPHDAERTRKLKQLCLLELAYASDDFVEALAAWLHLPDAAPRADDLPVADVDSDLLWHLAERTEWKYAGLRGFMAAPDALLFVFAPSGVCVRSAGPRALHDCVGLSARDVGDVIDWPELTSLIRAALHGGTHKSFGPKWFAHASPLRGGGALVVMALEMWRTATTA